MPVRDADLASHMQTIFSGYRVGLDLNSWIDPAESAASRRPRNWPKVSASPALPDAIEELEQVEANARRLRLFLESLRDGMPARTCESCGKDMYGRADQRYCSGACRQQAHRKRAPVIADCR